MCIQRSASPSLSSCRFAFDWDDDGFACSKTMEISNLSLSLYYEYHHLDSGSKLSRRFCLGASNCHETQMRFVLILCRWYCTHSVLVASFTRVAVFHRDHETEFVHHH
jgi:hypothetical protein